MEIETGNLGDLETRGSGWVVGFSPETEEGSGLRFVPDAKDTTGPCIKWMAHLIGDGRGRNKPVNEGRTLSVLVSETGEFRLKFSCDPSLAEGVHEVVLRRHGDYAIWGGGIYHEWTVAEACTIMTIRWK